jgi:V8-like Glu-specific endopeptidase
MSDQMLASLDLDDLTPKQLRKILNGVARSQLPYAKKTKEEQEADKEKASEDSEALADLHKEKKGDSKAPTVLASDLPVKSEDEDEVEEDSPKKKKRV